MFSIKNRHLWDICAPVVGMHCSAGEMVFCLSTLTMSAQFDYINVHRYCTDLQRSACKKGRVGFGGVRSPCYLWIGGVRSPWCVLNCPNVWPDVSKTYRWMYLSRYWADVSETLYDDNRYWALATDTVVGDCVPLLLSQDHSRIQRNRFNIWETIRLIMMKAGAAMNYISRISSIAASLVNFSCRGRLLT